MNTISHVLFAGRPSPIWSVATLLVCLHPLLSHGESLTFNDALALAVTQAPVLSARASEIDAARQAAIPAGELPDPRLAVGVENLPIEGPDQFSLTRDFMTMERVGLMQEFPNHSKRKARIDRALAKVTVMEARSQIARQLVLREAAVGWIARHSIEQQLALLDQLSAENELFAKSVRAAYAGGKGSATDLVMPAQEAAMIEERRDRLGARQAREVAALRQWIGSAAELPLSGDIPELALDQDSLAHRLHQHPELVAFDSESRVLDAQVAEAAADKHPDWALEFSYQHRGSQFSDMVMLQISIDLPLFAESRQNPRIAAEVARRKALDAERETSLREHQAMLEGDFAEYERLRRSATRLNDVLIPLAEEKVALALAAWRGGQGQMTEVLAARRERIETKLKAIAVSGTREKLAARLHYSYAQPDDDRIANLQGVQR
ncbi:MAG: TolC family protein [Gammaproteobacteria bacterium]